MERKTPVAVLGATGAVGQRFLELLEDHPWFRVAWVSASERRAGQRYDQEVRWLLPGEIPVAVAGLPLLKPKEIPEEAELAFSALPSSVAGPLESHWAEAGVPVVSNAASHRMDPAVPLLVPEVNPDQIELARQQARNRRGGFIATNPNCSTAILALALAPLQQAFGLDRLVVATYQAASGAGYPGVPSMDLLGNVIPHISGEEEKMAQEPRKILGLPDLLISPHCCRVPVQDGHLMVVSLALNAPEATLADLRRALEEFRPARRVRRLPSAPIPPIRYLEGTDRPQPRLDRLLGGGMAVAVGRLRPCPVLGWSMTILGHNTLRGAAGGAILAAELLRSEGLIPNRV